jgi:signal transduction histidine kinase
MGNFKKLSSSNDGQQMSWFRRLSLSRKILLGILPLFLLFITVSVVLQNHFQEQEMMEQAQASAHTYGDIIKESLVSMMVNNYEVDNSFLERLNSIQQFDTAHILVNDLRLRRELLTPKHLERLETKYKTLQPHDELERTVLATGLPKFTRDGDHFRGVVPFTATVVCQKCHAVPVGYTLGATDLHISLEQIARVASGNWKRSFLIFLGFAGLAIAVATFMFTRYVSKPIEQLVVATKEISRGNLGYIIEHPCSFGAGGNQSSDELNFLAKMLDTMRQSLQEKIGQLDQANANLSERNKEIEEALQKLKQLQGELIRSERLAVTGKMTAQLSHEINNPIHNIQSLLESSLRKVGGNDQAKELIGIALQEVTRMATLTRQMLDFYRDSVVDIPHEHVDVAALLGEIGKLYLEPLSNQNITLTFDVAPALPLLEGSRDKLKQVFINLISNARDAMPNGGSIRIRTAAARGGLSITVSDTGVGIPTENIGRIFDAFFTTKKELSGVGLGLSVSYGIIQQHKGSIEVQSTVGEGTTFTIKLPTM